MENNYSFFYHLQIAKCGGTYLNNMIIHNIFNILQKNKIQYIDGEYHLGWQEIPNIYTISCFRDPVKRTVSHYAYYKNGGQNGPIPKGVPGFIEWVKQNEQILSNYQVKNFLYTKRNMLLNPFNPDGIDPDFLNIEIDKTKALNRIKNTKILLKNSQLNEENCIKVMGKIFSDFGIHDIPFINKKKQHDHNITPGAKEIFNNLNSKEIDYIYSINDMDSEIYFLNNLYFNEGN